MSNPIDLHAVIDLVSNARGLVQEVMQNGGSTSSTLTGFNELSSDEKKLAKRISAQLKKSIETNHLTGYTRYYDGKGFVYTTTNAEKGQNSTDEHYDNFSTKAVGAVCDIISDMVIQSTKISNVPFEVLERIFFEFMDDTNNRNFIYGDSFKSIKLGSTLFGRLDNDHQIITIKINILFVFIVKELLKMYRDSFAIDGGESDESKLKILDDLLKDVGYCLQATVAHEMYHASQVHTRVVYDDEENKQIGVNTDFDEYNDSLREGTARLFESIMLIKAARHDQSTGRIAF